jgi:starch synthase
MPDILNICLVASEVAPWSKTGGLGDVCGALPEALATRGHRVITVSPRYKAYADAWDTRATARIYLFGQHHEVRFFHALKNGVHNFFVDHPSFHRSGIYGDKSGVYGDNLFRFALLTRAAIEATQVAAGGEPALAEASNEQIVFHANDWHTSLLPLYLDALYRPAGRFARAGTVLGLHNLGHHGSFAAHEFAGLDLSTRWWPQLDFSGTMNLLKAGIVTADQLVAVSPTYAKEIQQDLGFGLEGLLKWRADSLTGILNGIGPEWNPETDIHLSKNYSADDLSGKSLCKAALQKELGIAVRLELPLLGVVARLDHQKGIDMISGIVPELVRQGAQVVLLGSGSDALAKKFREYRERWPYQIGVHIGFSEALAHQIEAGADIFLMPSRFEPCGLNQMYSLKYGTIPIVHATGGLADTVESFDPWQNTGNGWAFKGLSSDNLLTATNLAMYTWRHHPESWAGLQKRGMRADFSWDKAAKNYEQVYSQALSR